MPQPQQCVASEAHRTATMPKSLRFVFLVLGWCPASIEVEAANGHSKKAVLTSGLCDRKQTPLNIVILACPLCIGVTEYTLKQRWLQGEGGVGKDWGTGVCITTNFEIVTTGCFEGNATYGQGDHKTYLNSRGSTDMFLTKLSSGKPVENKLWFVFLQQSTHRSSRWYSALGGQRRKCNRK